MDEFHLLQNRRFTRLSSSCGGLVSRNTGKTEKSSAAGVPTEQKHLDLVLLHHLVPLELVLDLLISRLPLLILSAHSTTHFGGFFFWSIRICITRKGG